ncbi:hypothetical protein C0989_001455 [Termitomyces sp. Mn162]|nr:hypothetical protein C0989_001455 [Termitomyces sp. Mn162]
MQLATTLKGKGKGKGKAREEEEFEEPIENLFTNKHLANLLHWQKALMVVDTGMEAGVVLEKAKGKSTVLLEKQQAFRQQQGACNDCWVENNPEGCCKEEEEETEDVEMRKKTPFATITKVKPVVSNGDIEAEEEEMEVEKNEESKDEERVQQQGAWSSTPLQQISNNELEWLGEDLALPTPLVSAMLLQGYNERAAGVERWF